MTRARPRFSLLLAAVLSARCGQSVNNGALDAAPDTAPPLDAPSPRDERPALDVPDAPMPPDVPRPMDARRDVAPTDYSDATPDVRDPWDEAALGTMCRPENLRTDCTFATRDDPFPIATCCGGRCYGSTACNADNTGGNACGVDPPCDLAAGMLCCFDYPSYRYHCVPRGVGGCGYAP
jgi:hypothetical protein